jgi:hypothetical protein
MPPVRVDLVLKPQYLGLAPGDIFILDYPARGVVDQVCRVLTREVGGPENPVVNLVAEYEYGRDTANDYVPPEDLFDIPETIGSADTLDPEIPFPVVRVSALPTDLKAGLLDGVLVAASRVTYAQTKLDVHFGFNSPSGQKFQLLDSTSRFPAHTRVIGFHQVREGNWLLRLAMVSELDGDAITQSLQESPELYCVFGLRLVRTQGTLKDQHQTIASWANRIVAGRFAAVSANVYDLEVMDGEFGTTALALERLSVDGAFPTHDLFVGQRDAFLVKPFNNLYFDRLKHNAVRSSSGTFADSDYIRLFKAIFTDTLAERTGFVLADYPASEFDRDNSTMAPGGTLTPEWGRRSQSTHEVFNIAAGSKLGGTVNGFYQYLSDLDVALGDVYEGDATDDQIVLVESINLTLGVVVAKRLTIYNSNP